MATRSREKSAARKANADKRPRAIAKYVRISSRKVKVVIDLIRGKSVAEGHPGLHPQGCQRAGA